MTADQRIQSSLEALDEEECRKLIAEGGVGRIAYRGRYGLVVFPVNYVMHDGAVVFRTAAGGSMDEDLRTGITDADYLVAFEIDRIDERTQKGWSVLIQGTASHADTTAERAALAGTGVRPWPGGPRDLYFRVIPTHITGRTLHGVADTDRPTRKAEADSPRSGT